MLVPCDMYSLRFASLSVLSVTIMVFIFFVLLKFMCGNFCDSFLNLESLLRIFLLRSWAKQGVLSLYMGVYVGWLWLVLVLKALCLVLCHRCSFNSH